MLFNNLIHLLSKDFLFLQIPNQIIQHFSIFIIYQVIWNQIPKH
nr:MAG TPA: hypothetical protein [Caudoviricetes sp.]